MTHTTLSAEPRELQGRKTEALRAEGKVPAVVYGFGIQPTNITIDRNAFLKAYAAAGESTVLDLEIAGVTHPVLIAEVQRNPLNDFVTHADFRRVDLSRTIEAKIPLTLVGTSSAVKDLGGTLVQSLEEIEVECLPNALVHDIAVAIDSLKTFDDVIRVSDIAIPEGITVKTAVETAVASVQPPRSEAEMAALDAAVDTDVSKVEVLTEKKEEEGAAAGEGEKKE
ncbi:50S ribosomal protein L25 [Candidatus Uhrbacteria bacterium]|nr:50S ribosomal protein L25 [Candidatus Uhrbacteria bacterium]